MDKLLANRSIRNMPTYVYETIPEKKGERAVQFEVKQSMKDAPLKTHPETGVPVRRLISGGYGFTGSSKGISDHGCCSGSTCESC